VTENLPAPTDLQPADIAPPRQQVDESCAGVPLDAWRRGDPYDGVMIAVRFVAEHPDVPCMAYCHDPIREVFQQTDDRQRKAGKAWAAREYPSLNIVMRTVTLPYRGVGNDVVVMYADIAKPSRRSAVPRGEAAS
jgi:hypothetical protein